MVGLPFAGTAYSSTLPFDHPRVFLLPWNNAVYALPGPHADWIANSITNDTTGPSRFPYYAYNLSTEIAGSVTGVAFAGTGNQNVFPSVAVPYKQRLALMNFGGAYRNTIVFTDDYTADVVGNDVLASNTRSISLVAGQDGDEIVAGIELMLTGMGTPAESGLLILRRYGTPFLLTGDMSQTGSGTSTLNIKRISIETGCAGPYTVARTPTGIVWAGADDVWAFAAGVLPTRIGQKIQPALKLTPPELQYRWSGVYYDGFYRLAVWGEGQAQGPTNAPGDQWWLDLRDGLPPDWRQARWWGPQQYLGGASVGVAPVAQTWGLLAETRSHKPRRLYYLDRVETSASVYSSVVGEYVPDPRDITAHAAYIADADLVDHEVVSELITKEYALKPPYQQVNDGVMATVRTDHDLMLTAEYSLDDGAYVTDRDKYIEANAPFLLDATALDGSNLLNNKVSPTRINPTTRRAASTHKFKLYDNAGWIIIEGVNDSVAVGLDPGTGFYTWWVGTVAAGAYTISDLATAVAAAINAAKPAASNNWGFTSAAGVYTLNAGGPYGVGVTMSVRFATFTVTPPDSGTAPTAAQAAACRRLFAILGFDVAGNLSAGPGVSPTIAGSTAPFKKGAAHYELSGLQINMDVISRTP